MGHGIGLVEVDGVLTTHRIAVWHVDLARSTDALLALEQETPRLAPGDHSRAAQQGHGDSGHPGARQRLAAYVAMRLVLERAFGTGVRGVTMTRSTEGQASGRPSLAGLGGDFSLAHVADHALIAIAPFGSVGVDLERSRSVRMTARRQTAIEQAAAILHEAAPLPAATPDRFLTAWVRLEAYAKARHIGMARLLTAIGAMGGAAPGSAEDIAGRLRALADRCDLASLDRSGAGPGGLAQAAAVHDLALPQGLFGATAWAGTGHAADLRQPPMLQRLPADLAGLRTVAP